MIALRERGDALADALDDAGALVPEHGRRVAGRVGARGRVEVGVADAAGDEPDEHLARPRLGQLELLNRERRAELLQDGGPDLHAAARPRQAARSSASRSGVRPTPSTVGSVGGAGDRLLDAAGSAGPRRRSRSTSDSHPGSGDPERQLHPLADLVLLEELVGHPGHVRAGEQLPPGDALRSSR